MDLQDRIRAQDIDRHPGEAAFAEFGPFALRLVYEVDGYALVCGDAFPARHAWLVTAALAEELPISPTFGASGGHRLALHQGTMAFLADEPQPE